MKPIYVQVPRLKQFILSPPRDKHELVNYCQRSQIAKKDLCCSPLASHTGNIKQSGPTSSKNDRIATFGGYLHIVFKIICC